MRLKYAILTGLLFLGLFPMAPAAQELNQTDAQKLAAAVNEAGSDQSLRSSATTVMQALMQFGDNDIKGAVSSAYKAYGSFKDSENLDRQRKQGILLKASMGSAENINLTEVETAFLASSTSYRRLRPSFLNSGDDAKIAADFERKTGIRRQDFLDMLAGAAENKLYVSDPNLAEKIDAEFVGFVEKIPDPEFRGKVKYALDLVPRLARHKMLVQAVQNMVQLVKKLSSPGGMAVEAPIGDPARASAARSLAALAEVPPANEADMAGPSMSLSSDEMARATDDNAGSHKLDNVIQAAIHDDPEKETIFEKVSRRYRMISPELAPRREKKSSRD